MRTEPCPCEGYDHDEWVNCHELLRNPASRIIREFLDRYPSDPKDTEHTDETETVHRRPVQREAPAQWECMGYCRVDCGGETCPGVKR